MKEPICCPPSTLTSIPCGQQMQSFFLFFPVEAHGPEATSCWQESEVRSDSSDTATQAKTKTYKYTQRHAPWHTHRVERGLHVYNTQYGQTGMVPASLNESFMIKWHRLGNTEVRHNFLFTLTTRWMQTSCLARSALDRLTRLLHSLWIWLESHFLIALQL